MIKATKNDIDRLVVYQRNGTIEIGRITSVNADFVFVRYGDDKHSKATLPADLDWRDDQEVTP